jgi:putative transposase
MPRTARIILKETPHHIVQRGYNREAVFIEPSDYHYYLKTLREWKEKLGVTLMVKITTAAASCSLFRSNAQKRVSESTDACYTLLHNCYLSPSPSLISLFRILARFRCFFP